jgi:hypothetical protein
MGRPKKIVQFETEPGTSRHVPEVKAAADHDEITYVPEDGDPVRVKWNGIEFKAHVPVKISRKHTVLSLIRKEREMSDGQIVSRALEQRIPMVDLARGNCRFMVNGEAPAERKTGRVAAPENSDEYRGYAMRWIAASTEPSAMDARWVSEEMLREKCGCDDADLVYLRPFFEARVEALGGGGNSGGGLKEYIPPEALTPEERAKGLR